MGLSLRELKEYLIEKGGYTITPNHNQLSDLKALVDDMMNVRSESPPPSGSGNYSGTTCNGHRAVSEYNLSLGDIADLDIKGCSCYTVDDRTPYCRSRTYYCSCNSNIPTCTCNSRTATTCDCKSRTSGSACNSNIAYPGMGEHQCRCFDQDGVYVCRSRVVGPWESCDCQSRTSTPVCACDSRTPDPCNCQSRTSSCGSRNTTSCTCNGRCSCNVEKRFE